MVVVAIAIAVLLAGLAAWLIFRPRKPQTLLPSRGIAASIKSRGAAPTSVPDASRAELANNLVTERLWKLAFAAAPEAQPLEPAHARVRDGVFAVLQADTLDPKYFPRRPTLMPQLLRAVDDPRSAPDKLARIVAHDPVLTSDVLRLANSPIYRTSPAPIETIQRAIVVLGVDALRGLVATAMLQPVFRATRSNFPRFPRMLWERTERAACAAELYALKALPGDRFEAQLLILLSALGPLVVYGAALDLYSQQPRLTPNATLLVDLTAALGPQETAQVGELIKQLKAEGIGIFLISHDIHDVFDLADRVAVMKNGQVVGIAKTRDVTKDEVLGMIILGKCPAAAIPGPGAMQ